MENFDEVLKEKTIHANNSEFFVFLPNDLTNVKSASGLDKNLNFRDAVDSKIAGNASFKQRQFDDAICYYTKAIEMLETMDKTTCASELAVCYQNRSAAQAHKKNYLKSISDASKSIELNDRYAKAYFRRSKTYYDQKKYYRALQDIVQACILERFKNKTYISLVCDILAEIDLDLPENRWKLAYEEMGSAELHCAHCLKQQLMFMKNCGILDQIILPIPKNQPATGYIRAMKGIKQLKVTDIMDGCNEEVAANGKYLAQSYILKAYMNIVVIESASILSEEWPRDMERMDKLILDPKTPEIIKFNAKLCRANLHIRRGQYREANRDLKSLEDQYDNTGQFHITKSGALFQLALRNEQFFEPLKKCCTVLPNVYELQFQKTNAESKQIKNKILSTTYLILELERLIKQFPAEVGPRMMLACIKIQLDDKNKAKKILKQAKKDLPNRMDEMCSLYGMLKPTHASCVSYFKQSLKFNEADPGSLEGLRDYYGTTTYEYAKALEVVTKALFTFLQEEDFKKMFEYRQALLKSIVRQDYWDKL